MVMKKNWKNRSGVSPVIATILMVLVTGDKDITIALDYIHDHEKRAEVVGEANSLSAFLVSKCESFGYGCHVLQLLARGSKLMQGQLAPRLKADTKVCTDLRVTDESGKPMSIHKYMLATSNGQYVQLSTPRGKKGHFFDSWESPEWKKITITVKDIHRIRPEFLASVKKDLGSRMGLRLKALSDHQFLEEAVKKVQELGTPEALGFDRRPRDIAVSLLLPAVMPSLE